MTIFSLRRHSGGLGLSPRRRRAKGATSPSIIQDGLVAEWRFDEGAGSTLTDYTGNGHDGTLGAGAEAPTWTPQGLSFDGNDVVVCDNAGISGGMARTFCAVVKRVGANELSQEWVGDGGSGSRWTYKVHGGVNTLFGECPPGFFWPDQLTIAAGWHFIAYAQSGSNVNTAVCYLDGAAQDIEQSQELNTAGHFQWATFNTTVRTVMEAAYGLVYDRALSPAEIEQTRQVLAATLAGRGIALP